MKIISILFPINLYLNIFQLEGYDILRFLKWIFRNFKTRAVSEKRKLTYTFKTRVLLTLSIAFIGFFFILLNVLTNNLYISFIISLIISTQFYLPLIIVRIILYPIELLVIQIEIFKTKQKIKSIKNLKVIAITGSYGKTSVKEILYQLIKDKYKTLRTPESYNTPLGIAKVIDWELDNSYEYFICEMAAYHRGDINNLCQMIPPTYGILTGITSQHLERFESLDNIIKTKFELYENIQNKDNFVFNLKDENVLNEVKNRNIEKPTDYLQISSTEYSKSGSRFDIIQNGKIYHVKTNLFGKSNIENITVATTMALKIGIDIDYLVSKIKNLRPIVSRSILKTLNKASIVDNTFSSNEESFKEMIETAKKVKGTKILVTPGLVELGEKESDINYSLGKLSINVFDKIILVGTNNRTKSLAKGLDIETEFIPDTRNDYFRKIEDLSKKYDWIFLENDVTENY